MKISIIGTGYVGLPTGIGFAEIGHDVVCIDKDENKIGMLQNGHVTLYEKGLKELFDVHSKSGKIKFTTFSRFQNYIAIIIKKWKYIIKIHIIYCFKFN